MTKQHYYIELKHAERKYQLEHDMPDHPGFLVDMDSFGPAAADLTIDIKRHLGLKPYDSSNGPRLWKALRPYGLPANILELWKADGINATGKGPTVEEGAFNWMGRNIGGLEQWGNNDGPHLRAWEGAIGDNLWRAHLPYCACVGLKVAYHYAKPGLDVSKAFPNLNGDYCPSIGDAIRRGLRGNGYKFVQVDVEKMKRGDFGTLQWGDGVEAHFFRCRKPFDGSGMATREANTPPSNAGDQSGLAGGDGMWDKYRMHKNMVVAGRIVKI